MKKVKIIHSIHKLFVINDVLFINVENTTINDENILGISYYGVLSENDLIPFWKIENDELIKILNYSVKKIIQKDFLKFNP